MNWHKRFESPPGDVTRTLFLRVLGFIYCIAFLSLWPQITGLIGTRGIAPAAQFLQSVHANFGWKSYWLLPTFAWLDAKDGFLKGICLGGALLGLAPVFGFFSSVVFALLWLLYLSLVVISQEFLAFQWDSLLLETGFLAIFFTKPSRTILWALRFLLFRLVFSSGVVKLVSGDSSWRNLTALSFHYETQPLTTSVAWYFHQLPSGFHKFSTGLVFAIELLVPFSIFAPRRIRLIGAASIGFLQIMILITGNYSFFNWLTISLCLLLLGCSDAEQSRYRRLLASAVAVMVIAAGSFHLLGLFVPRGTIPEPAARAAEWLSRYQIVNSYGLFAVMTKSRPEISVEGSNDAHTWATYEFRYKPGNLKRPPLWVAPHQPRLDWQMWFAALGTYQDNPWFVNFMARLLEGSPEVLALIERNPFPDRPPRYIRAVVYDYRFTDLATRKAEGAWWRREYKGVYCPVISLRNENH